MTGAASGIGKETVTRLLEQGYIVVATDRDEINSDDFPNSENLKTFQGDITEPAHHEELFDFVGKQYKKLDVLVNCAGVTFLDHQIKDNPAFGKLMEAVNVQAPKDMSKMFSSLLEEAEDGNIINIASYSGVNPAVTPLSLTYANGKAALIEFGEKLADSLGGRVRVNSVSPGFARTGIGGQVIGEDGEEIDIFDSLQNPAIAMQVSGAVGVSNPTDEDRLVKMDDIMDSIFMCIDNKKLNGHNVSPDGGLSKWSFADAKTFVETWGVRKHLRLGEKTKDFSQNKMKYSAYFAELMHFKRFPTRSIEQQVKEITSIAERSSNGNITIHSPGFRLDDGPKPPEAEMALEM